MTGEPWNSHVIKNITNYENVTFPQGYSIVSDILLGPSLSLVNDIVITGKTLTSISFTDTDFTSAEFTNCIFQDCSHFFEFVFLCEPSPTRILLQPASV